MLTADMIKKEIGGYFDEIVSFRRHLHMHPETGLDTKETEAYIRRFLESEGVGVLESQVGVIGYIQGGKSSGCCVALRADMDALPLAEENRRAVQISGSRQNARLRTRRTYRDAHGRGARAEQAPRRALRRRRSHIPAGRRRAVPRRSRDNARGFEKARASWKKIKAVIALHLTTEHPAGKVAIGWGSMMASTDEYDIEITGVGGHVGLPHRAVDALSIAAKFVTDMESFMSRRIDPFDSAVFGIGVMRAGSARNIIPEKAVLSGSLRCQREETRLYVLENAEKITQGALRSLRSEI